MTSTEAGTTDPLSDGGVDIDAARLRAEFIADVRRGLASPPRWLPPKYFYDALGSHLFEAICQLPWYTLTRDEMWILERRGAEMAALMGGPKAVIELGSGSGEKLALLVPHLRAADPVVHLVDVSATALDLSRRTLSALGVSVVMHRLGYEVGLSRAIAERQSGGPAVVLFLGSSIGNLDERAAVELLAAIRRPLAPGDALLLGTDLVKPERDLLLAYDDPIGVTAAFNRNVLARINTELDGDFDLTQYRHEARWNPTESRMEMHLVAERRQSVTIGAAGLELEIAAGEGIFTESSYKYTPSQVEGMARAAGYRCRTQWTDPHGRFAVSLLGVA